MTATDDDHQFVAHVLDAACPENAIRFRNTDTDETWDVARIDNRIVKVHHRTDELFAVDRAFVATGLLSPSVEHDRVPIENSRIDPATAREKYDCGSQTTDDQPELDIHYDD